MELKPYEVEVEECGGIRVGQRVRATQLWTAKLAASGARDYAEPFRIGGQVTRIVQHRKGIWTSVIVRLTIRPDWMSDEEAAFNPLHLEHIE